MFQDRFKSEPVEDDSYFLTVIRYIHQNPVKAGLCKKVEDYRYSSYNEYLKEPQIIDADQAFSLMKKESFIEYNNEPSSAVCLGVEKMNVRRVTDEEAHKIIKKYSRCESVSDFQSLPIAKRDKFLNVFKDKGISIRQISRLTGVSYYVVQKI